MLGFIQKWASDFWDCHLVVHAAFESHLQSSSHHSYWMSFWIDLCRMWNFLSSSYHWTLSSFSHPLCFLRGLFHLMMSHLRIWDYDIFLSLFPQVQIYHSSTFDMQSYSRKLIPICLLLWPVQVRNSLSFDWMIKCHQFLKLLDQSP